MAGALRVFVSSTSGDLGPCRHAVREVLLKHDILPVVQDQFPPDYRQLTEFLRHEVARCDAVICLVGELFGAAPATGPDPPRSYTQLEYDTASRLALPTFVFLTGKRFEPAKSVAESETCRDLQRQHRAALLERHKCEFFEALQELRDKLSDVVVRLRHLAGARDMLYLHPPARPAYFAGRTAELAQIHDALLSATPAAVAVVGMGGQGKTSLVREAVARLEYFPFAGGLWCTAYRSGFTFDAFLDEALRHFVGPTFDKRQAPDLAARARLLLVELQRRPLLVVIDGCEAWLAGGERQGGSATADTTTERQAAVPEFGDFLQQVTGLDNGTHLVLTTRAMPAALDHTSCAVIPLLEPGRALGLQGLDEPAAVQLLLRLGVQGPEQELRRVAASHGNHPLALEVLAGLLVQYEGGLIERSPQIKMLEPKRRLFELFDAARQRLPHRQQAERVLQVAAHFLEDPPLAALVEILNARQRGAARIVSWLTGAGGSHWSAAQVQEIVVGLAQWNLVSWDGVTKSLRLHPLIKEFFAGCAEDARELHGALAEYYNRQSALENAHTLADMKPRILAIEHALRAGRGAMCQALLFGPVQDQVGFGEWLAIHGHLACGIDLLQRAAEAETGAARAELLSVRGAMLRELGRADLALNDLDEAVQLVTAGGSRADGLLVAGILLNRANARRDRKLHPQALADYDLAVSRFELAGDDAGLRLVNALANRGNVQRDLGNLRRAIADYDRALDLLGKRAAPSSVVGTAQQARLLINRGISRGELWELHDAEQDLRRALAALSLGCPGGDEAATHLEWESLATIARVTLASLLGDAGRWGDGLAELKPALATLERLVNEGRGDLELRMGQAEMDQAELLVASGQCAPSVAAANGAVATFRRLTPTHGPEAEGFLAHALMIRSEAQQRLANSAAAEQDRGEALPILRAAVARGQMDIRPIYIRRLITGANAALDSGAPAVVESMLREAVDFVQADVHGNGHSESVRAQLRQRLRACFPDGVGVSPNAAVWLDRLREASAALPD
jgi:tetratricopeptide (TPR) repeat protein